MRSCSTVGVVVSFAAGASGAPVGAGPLPQPASDRTVERTARTLQKRCILTIVGEKLTDDGRGTLKRHLDALSNLIESAKG